MTEKIDRTAVFDPAVVSFHRMEDGTREDYALLDRAEREFVQALPDRLLAALRKLDHSLQGYPVSRLGHSLQTATRALKDGADDELIVAALIHDVGDDLAPYNHSEIAAGIIRPYVRPEVTWIVEQHGLFQTYYYAHHYDRDRKRPREISRPPLVPGLQGLLRGLGSVLIRSRLSIGTLEHI